ncbi:LysR family transcriptional regulator [Falsirhodobacter xinxiangensis]|uniref:LysR family transcriptional regulator n=1 Tax=Falsirhodobacter xinxiangensis TaxID=2530049 RepID=UPI0010AA307A|nr:LysR family transcriptional regulator [Rhodobacter xinxiangensis]
MVLKNELPDLATFAAVAEARSFTRAAGQLGMSQSALSHAIRRLEERMGVRLLTRSTRSIAPTEAGEHLLATLRPALDRIEGQVNALTTHRDQPAGTIRISSADHAAETILWPALQRFLSEYPGVTVEVQVENGFVDIVAERFDAGIRLGANVAKDMIAVPIGPPERLVVVASPAYLYRHPAPSAPRELVDHLCIDRTYPSRGGVSTWTFQKNGIEEKLRVNGRLVFNRPEMIVDAALAGFGIAYLLESQVQSHIDSGRLVKVLRDWCPSLPGYHLYYGSRRQHAAAFKLLVNALRFHTDKMAEFPRGSETSAGSKEIDRGKV